jgi:hypothetical protein
VEAERLDVLGCGRFARDGLRVDLRKEHGASDAGGEEIGTQRFCFASFAALDLQFLHDERGRRRLAEVGAPRAEHPLKPGGDLEHLRDAGLAHTRQQRAVVELLRGALTGMGYRLADTNHAISALRDCVETDSLADLVRKALGVLRQRPSAGFESKRK